MIFTAPVSRVNQLGCALVGVALAAGCGNDEKPVADQTPSSGVPVASEGDPPPTQGGDVSAPPGEQVPSRGPEHPVYSLVDNRLSAHLSRDGGLLVPAGSAGFAKYLRFGRSKLPWGIRDEHDDTPVAIMTGKGGSVEVPITPEQASGTPAVRLRLHAEGEGHLSIRVNGDEKNEVTAEFAEGWTTAEATLPEGALDAGENQLTFFASERDLEVAWIQVGGDSAPDEVGDLYDGEALVLDGIGLTYYVMVPDEGRVTADIDDPACAVTVTATPHEGEPITGELRGEGSAVELAPLGGHVVRLSLDAADDCDPARLSGAALVVPGEAPRVERGEPPRYVILWIMDSLRADRLAPFVPGARPEVPTFEELAETSALFTQTYVQGNESKSSHASIWTSLYPAAHRMIGGRNELNEELLTIDEVLDEAGLYLSGVSGNGWVIPRRGFGDSWDAFRNHIHVAGGLRGKDIVGKGMASIEGKDEPWFLYLGTIDTHVSWRAKEPWMSRYDPEPYQGRFETSASGAEVEKIAAGKLKISDRDITRIIAIYDSNVSYQDDLLGNVFDRLETWGIADQTMVVVTSDHGDEQWEVGRVGHGGSLRDSLIHVPLLIHYPPLFPGGAVSEGAEVIDILPTIADALGIEPKEPWQGQSLLPLTHGVGAGYPRLSMASHGEIWHAGRIGPWKLWVAGGNTRGFYDLGGEPEEKTDITGEAPIARRFVADALWMLRAYNRQWKKRDWGNPANVTPEFAADMGE